MSVINSIPLIAAGDDGYQISRSVRLRSSASAYLNRTPASTTNQNKYTVSAWIKLGTINTQFSLLEAGTSVGNDATGIMISAGTSPYIFFGYLTGGTWRAQVYTNALLRDPSAWYHIVVAIDTTQTYASGNYCKIYINGVLQTLTLGLSPNGTATTAINTSGVVHRIGLGWLYSNYTDGYITEYNFIDGQFLTASSFGETNAVTGVWQPKAYTGTYGTNGFELNFSDNSNNTAATIGKDYSGNGNNWTPNNISVTAGVTYDSMIDVPTNYADGGNGRGNYCVFNPLVGTHSNTYSNGNLQVATSTANAAFSHQRATFGLSSGKWYWEITCQATSSAYYIVGITADTVNPDSQYVGQGNSYCYRNDTGQKGNNGTFSSYGATFTTGDIIGVEFDADAGTLVFYKNGTSQGTAFTGISGTYFPAVADLDNNTSRNSTFIANFGQRPFTYTPPTGFVALNTQNLPAPTISNGAQYMAASLFTGTSGNVTVSNAVNGISFQPDFLWVKARSNAQGHSNADSVRGASKLLQTNLTNAESTLTNPPTFNADGFTSTTDIHTNGYTYVGWQWKAGGTAVSNTAGTITSSVSANPTAGFSVVTYTGTGSAATVGHGLGVAPKMVIIKNRTTAASWPVYHASIGNTAAVFLNATNASTTSSTYFNNTSPTSSVFSVESATATNGSTNSMVAYCFAEVAGYSKFGSYTGNGNSSDGPFVYCGFRPRWVMIKRTDSAGNNWVILDTSRDIYNAAGLYLYPNLSAAEDDYRASTGPVDILSNGFKQRSTLTNVNASGGTYIFMAVAENPFKLSLAR